MPKERTEDKTYKNPNLKLFVIIAVCTFLLVAIDIKFMIVKKMVPVTASREVPVEYAEYEPDLPEGTYVEQTFVSAGDPVYGVSSMQSTIKVGNSRIAHTVYNFYKFIPCITASGSKVWIGCHTVIAVDGGYGLGSGDKYNLYKEREVFNSLIPEDGSEFVVRGNIAEIKDSAILEPDPYSYLTLNKFSDPEKYNAVVTELAEVSSSGRYFNAFTEAETTRTENVIVGYEKRYKASFPFLLLAIAEIVVAVILYNKMKKTVPVTFTDPILSNWNKQGTYNTPDKSEKKEVIPTKNEINDGKGWTCFKCKKRNLEHVYICECGLKKSESDKRYEELKKRRDESELKILYEMENRLLFSSMGAHGDQIELLRKKTGYVISAYNDGYPNRGAAGGREVSLPIRFLSKFKLEEFVDYLQSEFWTSWATIDVKVVVSEEKVKEFLSVTEYEDIDGKVPILSGGYVNTNSLSSAPKKKEPYDFLGILTSQLVAMWMSKEDDDYKEEYLRRLKMCGLSDETALEMLDYEESILQEFPRPELLDERFIAKPLFNLKDTVLPNNYQYYMKNFEYPLSYLIKISDEAEYHYWNSHELPLPDDVWTEIFFLSDRHQAIFIPFAENLVKNKGWTVEAVNTFSYNEQGMLEKYRWRKSVSSAAPYPWMREQKPKRNS